MTTFNTVLEDYICSGHSILLIETPETERVIGRIAEVCDNLNKIMAVWSITLGWVDKNGSPTMNDPQPESPPEDHLRAILSFDGDVICVMKDFNHYLDHSKYAAADMVLGWLNDLSIVCPSKRQAIIFVGSSYNIPKEISHLVTHVQFDTPDEEFIDSKINEICSSTITKDGSKLEPDKQTRQLIINSCRGMTDQQISDRIALAIRRHRGLDPQAAKTILDEKAGIIKASGLLNYIDPPAGGLSNIGGYDNLKSHIRLDKPCFDKKAIDFGIDPPKGILLVGVPGCGKTLLASAIASEFGFPLISMDVGNLMGSLVGQSEKQLKEAIRLIEGISPTVLICDEIEKSFGSQGDLDGGTSKRVFGMFLQWLNNRQSSVYVVATANQIQSLPPEFMRTGRFDAIFGLGLPNSMERAEIFKIHTAKRKRDINNYSLESLVDLTDGYTGSDIEQVVKLGLKIAFCENLELEDSHLVEAIKQIIPLSKTDPDRIKAIESWCTLHAKNANSTKENIHPKSKRVVSI